VPPRKSTPRRAGKLTPAAAHARYEELLAQAMTAPDPSAVLRQHSADPALPQSLRRALRAADGDGVRLTALLVAKLRFERLLRACSEAERLFQQDPAAFAQLFRRYHESTPLHDFFPAREAQRFLAFLAGPRAPPAS
jgi:hypothetical protein